MINVPFRANTTAEFFTPEYKEEAEQINAELAQVTGVMQGHIQDNGRAVAQFEAGNLDYVAEWMESDAPVSEAKALATFGLAALKLVHRHRKLWLEHGLPAGNAALQTYKEALVEAESNVRKEAANMGFVDGPRLNGAVAENAQVRGIREHLANIKLQVSRKGLMSDSGYQADILKGCIGHAAPRAWNNQTMLRG